MTNMMLVLRMMVAQMDGGAVGLTQCPATLQKWMFSGPEMGRVIIEFER